MRKIKNVFMFPGMVVGLLMVILSIFIVSSDARSRMLHDVDFRGRFAERTYPIVVILSIIIWTIALRILIKYITT